MWVLSRILIIMTVYLLLYLLASAASVLDISLIMLVDPVVKSPDTRKLVGVGGHLYECP